MTNYLLTGGGTAGHVNPLLAVADEIVRRQPGAKVIALGTKEGLESELVPKRGYRLETIAKLPFPRKPSPYALLFPIKFLIAVLEVSKLIRTEQIDVVVGFGGYASAPAYIAAKRTKTPLVIHEANALPGIANRIGARFAQVVAVAFEQSRLPNQVLVGMPLREEIERIATSPIQADARKHFGLALQDTTLLVTGGSLGAQSLNRVIVESIPLFRAAGIQVLHIVGGRSDLQSVSEPGYVRMKFCDRMDLAISAADFAVSRAGSATVSEFSAVGLPAAYVPYPAGNGEQRFNVEKLLSVEGGVMVADKDFNAQWVAEQLIPLISDHRRVSQMSKAAKSIGTIDGTRRLVDLVASVLPTVS